jgi:Flp pilus assembly protein TadB
MGKRSRKRPAADRSESTREERDARRRAASAQVRRGTRERPPAPWGTFPLTELVVLLALVFGVVGFIRLGTHSGKIMVGAAMVLGSLGGLEVSIREHFGGFKSHTTLLAASTAVFAMILISVIGGKSGVAVLGVIVGVGILVFVLSFYGLRQAFMRRSGGLGFR